MHSKTKSNIVSLYIGLQRVDPFKARESLTCCEEFSSRLAIREPSAIAATKLLLGSTQNEDPHSVLNSQRVSSLIRDAP